MTDLLKQNLETLRKSLKARPLTDQSQRFGGCHVTIRPEWVQPDEPQITHDHTELGELRRQGLSGRSYED